jgi:integrase
VVRPGSRLGAGAAPLHVQTPMLIALYTGQRREDVVTMTWQQDQGEMLRVRTSKTRALIDLPCHPVLRAHLDLVKKAAKVVSLTGPICLDQRQAVRASTRCRGGAAPGRKAPAGAQQPQHARAALCRGGADGRRRRDGRAIEAVLGHRTFKMALKYASARKRAAEGVAAMKGPG